jgi:LPXTG-motif cell wall-anchored protein
VNTVKTGDTNNVLLWAALFVVSCAGMAGITVVAKKRK